MNADLSKSQQELTTCHSYFLRVIIMSLLEQWSMSGAQLFSITRTITVISSLPAEFLCSNILSETDTTVNWDKSLILHSLAQEKQGHQDLEAWEIGRN